MSDYYSLPTTLGAAKLAAAANNNQALTLSHMAFGDANGIPYLPTSRVNATNLVNERYRVAVQFVVQDTQNPNVYIIKARIPANIGGFDVNEIGIFDTEGELIYLANYPRTFKPQITQGAGGELTIKLHVMASHTDIISIILDPHVITLTQDEGDNRYALKTELDAEAATRANADMALSIALAAEITNRENIDNTKADKTELDGEAATRANQDLALAIALGNEINNRINAFTLNKALNQLSLKHGTTIIKMGKVIYGELPAEAVDAAVSFDSHFPTACLFAIAVPFNPSPIGQNAFLVTTKEWTQYQIKFVMHELSGSFHQYEAGLIWFAIGE